MITIIEMHGPSRRLADRRRRACQREGPLAPTSSTCPRSTSTWTSSSPTSSECYKEKGNCIVAVSEGIHYADGSFVSEAKTAATDGFGHAQLGGLAAHARQRREGEDRREGPRHRALACCSAARAHCASQTDIDESFMSGKTAVEEMPSPASTDKMVGFECDRTNGYTCERQALRPDRCGQLREEVPAASGSTPRATMSPHDFVNYCLPLIQGETKLEKEDGLPRFARLKKVFAK